ncbi:hypothetical protein D3C73_761640 [compost metagenome]
MGMAQAVGQRFAGDLQDVDLLAGRQLEGQGVDVQVHLELAATGELLGGVLELLDQAGIVDLQTERGQQLAQLAIGVVQAFAQFRGDAFQGVHWFASTHQGLHAADLQLHVRQRLGQGVVQLAGDDRALFEQQQAMVLLTLALERQRGADQVGQGLDQLSFPGLGRMTVDEVRLEFTQLAALVADAEGLLAGVVMPVAGRAVAAGADLTAVGTVQGQQLLGRGLRLALQAQGQAQAGQALLEAPDQVIQAFGVGQARGQVTAALVQQLQRRIGLLQVQGFLLNLAFEGAMGFFDGLGHGVEAGRQLAQFVVGLVVDAHLEIAATKTLGRIHQLPERRDHAVLQFVQANQQNEHGAEQRHALDELLPALLLFALALQKADELVQPFDEGLRLGLEGHGIATLQCRVQHLAPLLLYLPVADLQCGGRAIFQHGLERLAVKAPLQAGGDVGDFAGGGTGGELPAQVVSLHAH